MQVKAIVATSATEPMTQTNITRREVGKRDVAFEILYCGICHSDLHSVRNDWGNATYPQVPGHEIVGRVTSVGEEVTRFKMGDLVAVGCIVDSCGHCEHCQHDHEQYCAELTFSFNSPDRISGGMTYGGFSKTYVCQEDYVLQMPHFENLAAAAPLLCAGITVYSPLRHWNAGPGKRVGIIGIGGLGHMAIKIAKAMGAEVTVYTTSPSKMKDAKRLGADHAILSTDKEQLKASPLQDLIIDTVSANHDINTFLHCLQVEGSLVLVGLPAEPMKVASFNLVHGRKSFSGSNIGGIAETQEMLDFCFKHGIVSECEVIEPKQVNEALERLDSNDVRYRFVIDMQGL